MTVGAPRDLNIPVKDEPPPDAMSDKEKRDVSSGNADQGKEKKYARKWLSNAVLINYFAVYAIVFVSGLSWSPDNVQYSLDSWVVVVLIGGVTGSATVYFWRRIVDFAYGS